jgi:glycopeptide antibiotics resistance protein/DNA-binding XRE family transcriptional regulator
MDLNKISNFIKAKRKELGITQDELAEKLFVTEKAISRWETGRGTPDISLLIPLSKELNIDVSELLNGEENKKSKNDVEQLIEYNEITKANKYNFQFKLTIFFYILSILSFLFYLRFEYDPNIEVNYFIRLLIIVIASIFVIIGNKIYSNNYVEKLEDKKKVLKLSHIIVFIYYVILLFNMVVFARYNSIDSYNLIPFKSIVDIFENGTIYEIIINIFGNLLVFMPLEYFLIKFFKVKKFSINFILSFGIVLSIELFQYVFKVGVLDIDDLILCTFGMMIFYTIYYRILNDLLKND